jgi:HupE / UreJ protein
MVSARILFAHCARSCLALLCFGLISATALAHQTGNSYLFVSEANGQLQVKLDFFVRDLNNLLQKTDQANEPSPPSPSPPSPDQLQALQRPITETIQRSLQIEVNELPVALEFIAQTVVLHNDGLYVRQHFAGPRLTNETRFVVIRYAFFTENDRLGRAFLKLQLGDEEMSSVFNQTHAIQRFAIGDTKRWSTIGLFTMAGAKHIWEGADHLLFLLTLLLPGLMLTNKLPAGSRGTTSLVVVKTRAAELFALKVITAFTLAHSITLGVSVMGWVSLPNKLIETMIALSITVSALMNLQMNLQMNVQSRFKSSHWKLAFGFGLIHGMGFANGLKELGLSASYFVETLFAFNLGVELGQLSAVILVAIPVLLLARSTEAKQWLLKYGSIAVLLTASVWLIQRLVGI